MSDRAVAGSEGAPMQELRDPRCARRLSAIRLVGLFAVKLLLAAWMLLYTVFAVRAVITLLTRTTSTDCTVLGVSCSAPPAGLIGLLHAMLGGILGAGVLGMVKFHRWVSVRNSFDVRHTWGYLFAPVLGGVLGLVVFALLQSGLLIFSGKPSSDTGLVTNLGYLAVGFLSGFGWDSATRRIETIITKFFSDAQAPKAQHDTVDGSSNIEASVTADRE